MLRTFENISPLEEFLETRKHDHSSLGFVPTMGALHEGHLSLIRASKKENDLTVCSIFVNPIQFNDPKDLEHYPRTLNEDLSLLKKEGCDVVFCPNSREIYPVPPSETFNFGDLENVMEGKYRPGHFTGVATVVKRLFEIVKPTRAYFGLKDFQQVTVIHAMTRQYNLPVEIVPCTTVRERNGLAMSSRNQLLSLQEKKQAEILYSTLKNTKAKSGFATIQEIKSDVIKRFEKTPNVRLEYFDIVDMYSLKSLKTWSDSKNVIACIAAYVGKVRLIDNMIIFS
jgi:pantoate--beta-alanine ligase